MPEFMPGETLTSLVGRTARLKGFSGLREFCTSIGLDHFQVGNGNPSEISKFANLSGLDCATLERAATRNIQSNNSKIGELVVHKNHLSRVWGRYCPDCIREDLAADNGIGRKVFERQIWELSYIRRCPHHGIELKQAIKERPTTRDYDTLAKILVQTEIEAVSSVQIPASSLECFILSKLDPIAYQYEENVHPWLQKIDVDVIVPLSEAIGFTDKLTTDKGMRSLSSLERHQCGSIGFDILRNGPTAFKKFMIKRAYGIRQIRERQPKKPSTARLFGHVGEYFFREQQREAAFPVFEIFFECFTKISPKEPGQTWFGQIIPDRSHHTIASLAKTVGLSTLVVRRLLTSNGILDATTSDLSADDIVVEANSSEALCHAAANCVSIAQVRKILGVSRKAEKSVLTALKLEKSPWAHAFDQGHYAIDSEAVEKALGRAFEGAEIITMCEVGMGRLHVVSRNQSIPMGKLLTQLLLKPDVWRGQLPENSGLKDLVIRYADIPQLLSSSKHSASQPAVGKVTASKQLRVSLQAIEWLHAEKKIFYLQETEHNSAAVGIRFLGDDFATFAETYVSPGIIKRYPGTNQIGGKRNLDQFGLKPVWDPKLAFAHWYKRSEAIDAGVLSPSAPIVDLWRENNQ